MIDEICLVCCECGNNELSLIAVYDYDNYSPSYDFHCYQCNTRGHIEDLITVEQFEMREDAE